MKANWKKYLPWVVFVAVGALLFGLFQHQQTRTPAREITFSELLVQIDEGRIHDVTISGNEISGHFNDNRSFTT
ncbi:MAG TPA: ATP-dependent metallopeptidase FtsH/Yme1/Tma family protein, partial [Methylocystis sp.]